MLRRQIDRVWTRVTLQARIIFLKPYRGKLKRQFLDQFSDKIQDIVPEVSREDIIIIATGLLAELRSVKNLQIRDRIVTDGGEDEAV